jgi:hypothetical protein
MSVKVPDTLPVPPGSGLIVQRCGFFVAPLPGHLQEMGLIIPIPFLLLAHNVRTYTRRSHAFSDHSGEGLR